MMDAPDMTPLVAPLVWDRMQNGAAKADTPLARYVVSGGCWALWTHTEGTTRYAAHEGTAKAAAQADYTARIIASLDPAALGAMLAEAEQREREACAKIADDAVSECCQKCGHPKNNHPYRHPFIGRSVGNIAAAIRARGVK